MRAGGARSIAIACAAWASIGGCYLSHERAPRSTTSCPAGAAWPLVIAGEGDVLAIDVVAVSECEVCVLLALGGPVTIGPVTIGEARLEPPAAGGAGFVCLDAEAHPLRSGLVGARDPEDRIADVPEAIAAAPDGTLYVVGHEGGTAFAGEITGAGFVAAHGPDGALLWERSLGARSVLLDVAVDRTGACLAGYATAEVDLGTGPLAPVGGSDAVVGCLAADGSPRWARLVGSSADDLAHAIAVRDSGTLVVGASFGGITRIDGVLVEHAPMADTVERAQDVVLLELAAAEGALRSARAFPMRERQVVHAIALDGDDVLLSGSYDFQPPLDPSEPLPRLGSGAYVLRLGARTTIAVAHSTGRRGLHADALVADDGGARAWIGYERALHVGPERIVALGESDVAELVITGDGSTRLGATFEGSGTDRVGGAARAFGAIVIAGAFEERVRIGDREVTGPAGRTVGLVHVERGVAGGE